MKNVLRYENLVRPTLEAGAAAAWFFAAVIAAIAGAASASLMVFVVPCVVFALAFAVVRTTGAFKHWRYKYGLSERYLDRLPLSQLKEWVAKYPDRIYLGQGFAWQPIHTQRLYQIRSMDPSAWKIPSLVTKWFDNQNNHRIRDPYPFGKGWLHGVGGEESAVYYQLKAAERMTAVAGTTGAGKTTLLILIIAQDGFRNDCAIFVVDPKGALELPPAMKDLAETMGRPFVYFHPTRSRASARIDMLGNWTRLTEVASRIVSQFPNDDSFSGFMWLVLDTLGTGLVYAGQKPSLAKLSDLAQNGASDLLQLVLKKVFDEHLPDWESMLAEQEAAKSGKPQPDVSPRLIAMVALYVRVVRPREAVRAADNLISLVTHNREHYQKMLASGLPLLRQMVSDSLGELLSPDYDDVNDERPIWTFDRMVREKAFVYLGLDSLSDSRISGVIGSLCVGNLTAVAGERYNTGDFDGSVALHVDEVGEVAQAQFTQILNKGGEAKVRATFYMQASADLEARLGVKAEALQMLANANNVISFRVEDNETRKFVAEKMGKVDIPRVNTGINVRSSTLENFAHFGGGYSANMSMSEVDVIPPAALGSFPNLQGVAIVEASKILKFRMPIVDRHA